MRPRAERRPRPDAGTAARDLQGRRAGIVTRMIANVLDLLVVILIVSLTYVVVAGFLFLLHPSSFSFPSGIGRSIPAVVLAVAVPYLAVCWTITGRTYGQAVLGLRTVSRRGERMRAVGALVRALACVVLPIGVLWVAVSPANRSVQDVLLRTSVIYDWLPATTAEVVRREPDRAA